MDLGINGEDSGKGIQDIKLGENLLERLDKNQLDPKSLDSLTNLNISGNPLNCNCDLAWMRGFGAFNQTRVSVWDRCACSLCVWVYVDEEVSTRQG